MKNLTFDEAKSLGLALKREVDAYQQSISALRARWETNEANYRCEEYKGQAVEGASTLHFPLVKPKLTTLVALVTAAVFGMKPFFSCEGTDRAEDVERELQALLDRAELEYAYSLALTLAGQTGKSFIWCRWKNAATGFLPEAEGRGASRGPLEYVGPTFTAVHPADFVAYPTSATSIVGCRTLGHCVVRRRVEIDEYVKAGIYKNYDTELSTAMDQRSGRDANFDRTSHMTTGDKDDDPIKLYYLLTKRRLGSDKIERWYEVTLAYDSAHVLRVVPYECPMPWYFEVALHQEPGSIVPADSVCNWLQGLQNAYSYLGNLAIDGLARAAFPVSFVADGGIDDEGYAAPKPGEMVAVDPGTQITQSPSQFDPSIIPMMMRQIEAMADAVTGVTPNASGRGIRAGNTTATEAEILASNMDTKMSNYIAHATHDLKRLIAFVYWLAQKNSAILEQAYGPTALSEIEEPVHFQVLGKSTQFLPSARINSLLQLTQLAVDPRSGIDMYELTRALLAASGLDARYSELQTPKSEIAQAQAQAMPEPGVPEAGAMSDQEFMDTPLSDLANMQL